MKDPTNILVLEDEQRAGEKLIDLIRQKEPAAAITWLRSVKEGIEFLAKTDDLDLMFSDIELLDGNAFDIFNAFTPSCPIIFCTAYDNFYVAAFETNGIAYLLKPYTEKEFYAAWNKYELMFANRNSQATPEALLKTLAPLLGGPSSSFKSTFSVKRKEGVFLLKAADIAYLQAQGDFVIAFDRNGGRHLLNHTLADLEKSLDPGKFFRINRSEIVHFEGLVKYAPYTKNRLALTLSAPSVILYTSNSRTAEFKKWLENH